LTLDFRKEDIPRNVAAKLSLVSYRL